MTAWKSFSFLLASLLVFSLCLGTTAFPQTPHTLTVNADPLDGGTVKADCGTPCQYTHGALAHLLALPHSGYVFDTWDGDQDCKGTGTNPNPSLVMKMEGDRNCLARFSPCADMPLQRGGFSFTTFWDAYRAQIADGTIRMLATTLQESILLDGTVPMVLKGGYDCGFHDNQSYTLLQGQMIVAKGSGTVERVMVLSGMPPVIASFTANPSSIIQGNTSTLIWNVADATTVLLDGVPVTELIHGSAVVSPTATRTYTLTASNAYGPPVTQSVTVTVAPPVQPKVTAFSASKDVISKGEDSTVTWTVTDATAVSIVPAIAPDPLGLSGSAEVSPTTTTVYTITAVNGAQTVTRTVTVGVIPPDPATVAPQVDPTVATTVYSSTFFLYSGSTPVQTGMAPNTIEARRAAVIRGKVLNKDNMPLPGVTVTILNHPGYGQTITRDDGMFDMAVNGGGSLTVNYAKTGHLPAHRQVSVPWHDYVVVPEVTLVPLDTRPTEIDLTSGETQVAQGNPVTDTDGTRQATLLIPQGTQAELVMPDGSTRPIATLHVRATEYTVGPNGPKAMPAKLPPTSGYTYAVELSADEALTAGATSVQFSQPLAAYVENFLNVPVGIAVPVAYYDKSKGAWVPSHDGRVIKILSISNGRAELDTNGDEAVDNGVAIGITDAERQQLADLYTPGRTLWRYPITHFTSYDTNYGIAPPLGATAGALPGAVPGNANQQDKPCKKEGLGCIEFQNQIFTEAIDVIGTPYRLHYASDRVPGFIANSLRIPLSKDTIPSPLKRIQLEVLVAGRTFVQGFPAVANQEYTFLWDGLDAYGRPLQGQQTATIRIGYVYDGYYALPPSTAASFGLPSGVRIPGDIPARQEVILWQEEQRMLNLWDAKSLGLGGWSLSPHHAYDPQAKVLHYGDGSRRSVDNMNDVFETYAGGGSVLGDGGPATKAKLKNQGGITVGPDGSLYISDGGNSRVRKVAPDGTITTVAGNGTASCFPTNACGDGGLAVQAPVCPSDVALGPDGSLYIADTCARRIRKVTADGIITRVAGAMSSSLIFNGDDIPALDAVILPRDLEIAPDGTIYFRDDTRNPDNSYRATVRRIGPDGIVHRYAGSGGGWNCNLGETCGDGGPAIDAAIGPTNIALGPDGSLYIYADNTYTVRRVRTDGIIETVAGKYDDQPGMADGVPATETHFFGWSVALDRKGLLHIGERGWWGPGGNLPSYRVRRVGNDQIIATVAGGANDNSYVPADEKGPAVGAHFNPYRIALGPDGSLFISDLFQGRVFKARTVFKGFDLGNILIASEDGTLLYEFSAEGRHLKTYNTLTGAALYQFGYDAQKRLISITDGDGNVTVVERDGQGKPTAIVGPYLQRTVLTLNGNGYLESVANPAGETTQLGYGNGGLLTGVTGPKGTEFTYSMTYDSMGRLVLAQGPAGAGGSSTLTRTDLANGHKVDITTAMNRSSSYLTETLPTGIKHDRNIFQDGTVAETTTGTDGIATTVFADGTVTASTLGPDPRFGMQAPIARSTAIAAGGLTSSTSSSRSVVLTDPNDPLSLSAMTDISTVNGRSFTTSYDAGTRTFTVTSPMGRQMSFTIDSQGRTTGSQTSGLEAISYSFDSNGRLSVITTGSGGSRRVSTLSYNIIDPADGARSGYLESVTDPLGQTTGFLHDLAGRITRQTFPDNRQVQYGYDGHGNLTSLVTPRGHTHSFEYSPVDLMSSYIAPGPTVTSYTYNKDRQLTRITRPELTQVDFSYDTSGRLQTLVLPGGGQILRSYDETTGKLSTITAADRGVLIFGYSGGLLTSETWTGTVAGSVSRTYNDDFWLTRRYINSGSAVGYQYDNDGLLIVAGDLTMTRNAQNGLLTGTTLGNVRDAWFYNGFAEPTDYTAGYGDAPAARMYSVQYTYDKLGRITQKSETIGGATDVHEYSYAPTGQLETVKKNSTQVFTYGYDDNGNRLSYSNGTTTVYGTYDVQDRLLTYGTTTYQYTANGELQSKTVGGQTTTYQYDALGNLVGVTIPGTPPTQVEYLVDGMNRRLGEKVNGTLVKGFLYGDRLSPVAELDGSNNLVSYFVYGSRSNVPDYMVKAGVTYRIISDHLGSPRLVVNAASGAIEQRLDYDEFGKVLPTSTNLGFQPFGFAGGLYDPETGLVRFGVRDYDPEVGRWTAKDPIGFAGGDTNLYGYVVNDPINAIDLHGLGPAQHTREEAFSLILQAYNDVYKSNRKKWWGKSDMAKGVWFDQGWWADLTYPLHYGKGGCADWSKDIEYELSSQFHKNPWMRQYYDYTNIQNFVKEFPFHHSAMLVTDKNNPDQRVVLDPWITGTPIVYPYKSWVNKMYGDPYTGPRGRLDNM